MIDLRSGNERRKIQMDVKIDYRMIDRRIVLVAAENKGLHYWRVGYNQGFDDATKLYLK